MCIFSQLKPITCVTTDSHVDTSSRGRPSKLECNCPKLCQFSAIISCYIVSSPIIISRIKSVPQIFLINKKLEESHILR